MLEDVNDHMHDCGPLIMKQLGDNCRWDFGANLLEIACAHFALPAVVRVLACMLVYVYACIVMYIHYVHVSQLHHALYYVHVLQLHHALNCMHQGHISIVFSHATSEGLKIQMSLKRIMLYFI